MKGIDKNVNPEETLVRMIASCGEVWEEENEMGRIAVDVSEFSKREGWLSPSRASSLRMMRRFIWFCT